MSQQGTHDMIREFRLRRWAREHYVPAAERRPTWDALVLDEMARRDRELATEPSSQPVSLQPPASRAA